MASSLAEPGSSGLIGKAVSTVLARQAGTDGAQDRALARSAGVCQRPRMSCANHCRLMAVRADEGGACFKGSKLTKAWRTC